jgi:lysophospholipase L1-like esterase
VGTGGAAGTAGTGAAGRGGSSGAAGGAAGRDAVGGAGAAGGRAGAGGGAAGHAGVWKVMPLGDSTTASICYRSHLWQMLTQNGHTNFDFIGTRNGDPGCSFTGYDKDNEGHGGYIVTDLLKAAGTGTRPSGADASDPYVSDARDLVTWFDGHPADIVLMHFGTNDVWNGIAPATILTAYTTILGRLRANNPNVHLYVAQITPLDPSGCSACISRVQTLDGMIPAWAASNATAASPITVVDQYTGFDATADTRDGVHANDAGSIKIATNWYDVLSLVF